MFGIYQRMRFLRPCGIKRPEVERRCALQKISPLFFVIITFSPLFTLCKLSMIPLNLTSYILHLTLRV